MKGLGVYYDCTKAEFLTPVGLKDMGPIHPEAQGLINNYRTILHMGELRGPKNTPINEKNDKNYDNNEVWNEE